MSLWFLRFCISSIPHLPPSPAIYTHTQKSLFKKQQQNRNKKIFKNPARRIQSNKTKKVTWRTTSLNFIWHGHFFRPCCPLTKPRVLKNSRSQRMPCVAYLKYTRQAPGGSDSTDVQDSCFLALSVTSHSITAKTILEKWKWKSKVKTERSTNCPTLCDWQPVTFQPRWKAR